MPRGMPEVEFLTNLRLPSLLLVRRSELSKFAGKSPRSHATPCDLDSTMAEACFAVGADIFVYDRLGARRWIQIKSLARNMPGIEAHASNATRSPRDKSRGG